MLPSRIPQTLDSLGCNTRRFVGNPRTPHVLAQTIGRRLAALGRYPLEQCFHRLARPASSPQPFPRLAFAPPRFGKILFHAYFLLSNTDTH